MTHDGSETIIILQKLENLNKNPQSLCSETITLLFSKCHLRKVHDIGLSCPSSATLVGTGACLFFSALFLVFNCKIHCISFFIKELIFVYSDI